MARRSPLQLLLYAVGCPYSTPAGLRQQVRDNLQKSKIPIVTMHCYAMPCLAVSAIPGFSPLSSLLGPLSSIFRAIVQLCGNAGKCLVTSARGLAGLDLSFGPHHSIRDFEYT